MADTSGKAHGAWAVGEEQRAAWTLRGEASEPRRSWATRDVALLRAPEMMRRHGQFPRDGDDGAFLRRLPPARGEREAPASQIRVGPKWAEDVFRA